MPSVKGLKITTQPATEPVTVAEAKAHLRVDISEDDTIIGTMITTARKYCEQVSRRQFITATYTWKMDDFPVVDEIEVPVSPLIAVSSISYEDTDSATQTLSTDVYQVDAHGDPGRIGLKDGQDWPDVADEWNAVTITFTAGYGSSASDVPQQFKDAIKLIVGDLYENRQETITGTIVASLPRGVRSLLAVDGFARIG